MKIETAAMFPILRSRPSQMLVAMLCALVLSRMPAPIFAEDAISSMVKIEEAAAIAAVIAPTLGSALCDCAVVIPIAAAARSDAPSAVEHSILRL